MDKRRTYIAKVRYYLWHNLSLKIYLQDLESTWFSLGLTKYACNIRYMGIYFLICFMSKTLITRIFFQKQLIKKWAYLRKSQVILRKYIGHTWYFLANTRTFFYNKICNAQSYRVLWIKNLLLKFKLIMYRNPLRPILGPGPKKLWTWTDWGQLWVK